MDEQKKTGICKRIRQIRLIDLEMSQAEFAKAVGTSQGIISQIESGKKLPTMEVFCNIVEVAKERSADWILNGIDLNIT